MKDIIWFVAIVTLAGCKRSSMDVIEPPPGLRVESLFAINDSASVTLGWTPIFSLSPFEFVLYRDTTPDFELSTDTRYATIPSHAAQYIDTLLTNGTYYYYRLVPTEVLSNGLRKAGQPSNVAIARPYDYNSISTIQYSHHIQPIFTSGCAVHACHVGEDNGGQGEENLLLKTVHGGQFSLKSWADLFDGSKDGAVVVPFKALKSDLVFHLNSDTLLAPTAQPHMPLDGFNLPRSQVQTLIRWIENGGPNDQGAIAFTTNSLGKVLVVNALEDLVASIDVQKNLVARYVDVGSSADTTLPFGSPHHVRVDRQGRYFYVTLITSRELWKFSARTYEFLGKTTIPSQPGRSAQPADIAISAGGDTAFVSDFNSAPGRVVMVNTNSMQVIGAITLFFPPLPPSLPHGLFLTPDGSRLFTTNTGTGNISVIRLSDMTQSIITLDTTGSSITTNTKPYLCDMTPDGRYLLVTDFKIDAQNLYVIDFTRDSTKAWRAIPIGGRSVHVAVAPNGQNAYVCNFGNDIVNVLNIPSFSVSTITNVGHQPHGVIFTPDGSLAYVSTENLTSSDPPHHPLAGSRGISFVSVIDVSSRTVIKKIEVGGWGQGLIFSP